VEATIPAGQGIDGVLIHGGAIWVESDRDHVLRRVDPATNTVVASLDLGTEPRNLAFGAGSLWVADFGGDQVLRIALR